MYIPAARLLGIILPDQFIFSVPVPPLVVRITDPSLPPLQLTLVIDSITVIAGGSLIITASDRVQPLSSVIR